MSIWFLRHPAEENLALFAGGELGPLARWRIEGHLTRCGGCRQVVTEFFELRSEVMDLADLPHLDWAEMAANIQRRLEAEPRRPARVLPLRPAWGAALAIVLLAAGFYLSRNPAEAVVDASGGAVELRMGSRPVLTLMNAAESESQVTRRVSAGAVSARYLDKDTGYITVNHVYTE